MKVFFNSAWHLKFFFRLPLVLLFLLFVPSAFTGCDDFEDASAESQPGNCRFVGRVRLSQDLAEMLESSPAGSQVSCSRGAMPYCSSPAYDVIVWRDGNYYPDSAFYQNTPIQISDGIFEVSLESGNQYNVQVRIKDGSEVFMSIETGIFTIDEETPLFDYTFDFTPGTEATGIMALEMNVPASVARVDVTSDNTSWPSDLATVTASGGKITLSNTSLASGSYNLVLKFYDAATDGNLLYTSRQLVQVFDGMTTKRWVSANASDALIGSDGSFSLTQAIIDRSKRTVFYVSPKTPAGAYSDDNNEGSAYSPFKTCAAAVAAIVANNNPDADYTIFINGSVSISPAANTVCSLNTELNDKAHSILLTGVTGPSADSLVSTISTTATLNYPIVAISCTVPVTIRKLTIGRTSTPSSNPSSASASGIKISAGSYVVMEKETVITGNYASNGGGVNNAGTFIMKGGKIISNSTVTSTSYGAGVYNTGIFSMEGGVITENGFFTDAVYGGGVCNKGENAKFYMSGDAVIGDNSKDSPASSTVGSYSNKATSGAGLYNKDKACAYLGYKYDENNSDNYIASTLNGGIYYNYASSSGGGIYNASGEIYIASGNISLNYAGSGGGGAILNASGASSGYSIIEMKGGTVTNNAANLTGEDVIKGGVNNQQTNWSRDGDYLALNGLSIGKNAYLPMTSAYDYIYLYYGATSSRASLTLNEPLSLPEGAACAATIAVDSDKYLTTWPVLTGELTYRQSDHSKIAVKPQVLDGVEKTWTINDTGKLTDE